MKLKMNLCLLGACLVAGWTIPAVAQDPVVPITPTPEYGSSIVVGDSASQAAHSHVACNCGGNHAAGECVAQRGSLGGHMERASMHPHPIYTHSPRGRAATWTHAWNQQQAGMYPWHGNYYHYQYGAPPALVVPPTASFQTNWSWGVGRTTSTPIYHQFGQSYPGMATGGPHGLYRTPQWPSNTNQFGIYYIRGPW